jgi:4-amino-4-deoxy-L-arabinose transferase-like glycosyltransferase
MPHRLIVRDYVLLWGILVIAGLVCRPLMPVDETRAVSVAWEMWQRGDFLVPHLNGEVYSHKPPLLQWGIHLSWLLAGVNEWTPRLVAPLFGLANLLLTAALARRLWPDRPEVHRLAPLILLSLPIWALWTTLTLYDMLVAFFALLGMLGVWRAGRGELRMGCLLVGIAIGGGVLSKGPVILLFILPVGLLAPWWLAARPAQGWPGWYLGLLGAVLLGAVLALSWAVPAGIVGGEEYRRAIFWGQSAGRIAHSFAHGRPWWWYGAVLPILLFPWGFRLSFWRARPWRKITDDPGLKFCLLHIAAVILLLSLISGKQIHYALPVLPAAALVLARLLPESSERMAWVDRWMLGTVFVGLGLALVILPGMAGAGSEAERIAESAPLAAKLAIMTTGLLLFFFRRPALFPALRGTACALIGVVVAAHLVYLAGKRPRDDMQPMAARLADLQGRGASVAHWGKYSGDFQFLGRLRHPLKVLLNDKEFAEWLAAHPDDYVLIVYRSDGSVQSFGAEFSQDYRSRRRRAGLWKASVLSAEPGLLAALIRRGQAADEGDRS